MWDRYVRQNEALARLIASRLEPGQLLVVGEGVSHCCVNSPFLLLLLVNCMFERFGRVFVFVEGAAPDERNSANPSDKVAAYYTPEFVDILSVLSGLPNVNLHYPESEAQQDAGEILASKPSDPFTFITIRDAIAWHSMQRVIEQNPEQPAIAYFGSRHVVAHGDYKPPDSMVREVRKLLGLRGIDPNLAGISLADCARMSGWPVVRGFFCARSTVVPSRQEDIKSALLSPIAIKSSGKTFVASFERAVIGYPMVFGRSSWDYWSRSGAPRCLGGASRADARLRDWSLRCLRASVDDAVGKSSQPCLLRYRFASLVDLYRRGASATELLRAAVKLIALCPSGPLRTYCQSLARSIADPNSNLREKDNPFAFYKERVYAG